MYKKLLSNLSFNPSLIGKVSFYAKRLHKEEKIRRLGVLSIILAVLIQMSAVVSPPEQSLAESNNDILRGGFTSREQAVNYCRTNNQNFAVILDYFRVTCNILSTASTHRIRSTSFDYKLDSMGRNSQGQVIARTGKPTNEYPVSIAGNTYYMKNLWAWDSSSYSEYNILNMQNLDGKVVMVMYDCGNIITIDPYTPPPPPAPEPLPPPPTPTPEDECPNVPGRQTRPSQCDVCPNIPGIQYTLQQCDVCPNVPGIQTRPSQCDVCPNVPGIQYTLQQCDVCPNVPGIQSKPSECYPCPEASKDNGNTVCLELKKTASNQTRNIQNADGTTAFAGDTIIYTLSVNNKGNQTVRDFVIEENMSDVLQYSDVIDLNGGKKDNDNNIFWPKTDIRAKDTVKKNITIKIKNPIPQTPVSASDPSAYDLMMTNVFYGSAVNIKLPPSVSKTTEQIVSTLPNTGPSSSVVASISIVVFVSYFLARVRLLAKETDIVKKNYVNGEV